MDSPLDEPTVVKEDQDEVAVPTAVLEKPKISDMDTDDDGLINYKDKYRNLKRKLKCLLFEQECFHEELRKVQRKCLRVNRDKSFLLDHLMKYEEPDMSSTDDEMTESTEEEQEYVQEPKKVLKKKKKKSSSVKSKSSAKSTDQKNANNGVVADKVRCKKIENGKQCPKLVSMKVKSGICYAHRQQMNAEKQDSLANSPGNNSSTKDETSSISVSSSSKTKTSGGKDISQIREAMEASICTPSENPSIHGEEDDDLVIDLPT